MPTLLDRSNEGRLTLRTGRSSRVGVELKQVKTDSVLGNEMKRLWGTLLATAIGFAMALLLGDLGRLNHWPEKPYHGCYEIDACNVPWWILTIFVLWLLGPSVIYGYVGYVGLGRKWSAVRWIVTGSILLLGTVAFYLSWYAYRAFI